MSRITLHFAVSDTSSLQDLLHEFALHSEVAATAIDGSLTIAVETDNRPASLWEVRATVGMFDDRAQEILIP